jgi:hypothetical protein
VEHPRQPRRGQGADGDRQVGGEAGATALIVDERQLGAIGQAEHGLHHVVTVLAAHP